MNISSLLRPEINYFYQDISRIRNVLSETADLFDDIEAATQISRVRLSGEKFSEEDDIRDLIKSTPAIVIFGKSQTAKGRLVNKIFGEEIYPEIDETDQSSWRTVRFKYGRLQTVGMTLPDDEYEVVDNLVAYDRPWKTLPLEDVKVKPVSQDADGSLNNAVLDVQLSNALLKEGLQITVTPSNIDKSLADSVKTWTSGIVPVCLYAVQGLLLSDQEILELSELEEKNTSIPMLFVPIEESEANVSSEDKSTSLTRLGIYEQLARIGLLTMLPGSDTRMQGTVNGEQLSSFLESDVVDDTAKFPQKLCSFLSTSLKSRLITITTMLQIVHKRSLNNFIMKAFDMQRDMLITPRRLEFARTKEQELSENLMKLALDKQEEIKNLVSDTVQASRSNIITNAGNYEFIGVNMAADLKVSTGRDLRICYGQIREFIVGRLNQLIAGKLVESINVLRESYIGTLTRCVDGLEQQDKEASYSSNGANKESHAATSALRQILNAAYLINVQIGPANTFLRGFFNKMKELLQSLPWHVQPKVDRAWKEKAACDMLDGLNVSKLAKSIGEQFRDRLKQSHDQFSQALKQLEAHHTGRLGKAEESRQKLRKIHAPRISKLALESCSLRDLIMYGMPLCGREIGRGQYGVVYSCDEWAGVNYCAIKSVVPPDEKHMNDLALEFYYTKNVPEHDRIVRLIGSVIDYTYGGGTTPAVLIVMERMQRDFYTAIKTGLDWMSRLQVSIDVIEGIRYLHSQGLVHRDIKLKNVLLTKDTNRGKLTDLGFCKPEAMMSGSIVGTPIHMAPELFSGFYDNSVDVYAFGILFWYVCAGHTRLPLNFEQCNSKDELFVNVRKGRRPERLTEFDEDCWSLMTECWDPLPTKRPLTGSVAETLESIYNRFKDNPELITQKNIVRTEVRGRYKKGQKRSKHYPFWGGG